MSGCPASYFCGEAHAQTLWFVKTSRELARAFFGVVDLPRNILNRLLTTQIVVRD
jgi:hypothetical protein